MFTARHEKLGTRRRLSRFSRASGLSLTWVVLFFTCLMLLVLSRLEHKGLKSARAHVIEQVRPQFSLVRDAAQPIFNIVTLFSNNRDLEKQLKRLRAENRDLRGWRWQATRLQRQLTQLRSQSVAAIQDGLDVQVGKVLMRSSGAFAHSVVIDVGREHGVGVGYPVMQGHFLIGRVIEVSNATARVLFLTDGESRIPVSVGKDRHRALLIGTSSGGLRLQYLKKGAGPKVGDRVVTSGVAGHLQAGLKVGRIHDVTDHVSVKLIANLGDLDFVQVVIPQGNPAVVAKGHPKEHEVERPVTLHTSQKLNQPLTFDKQARE